MPRAPKKTQPPRAPRLLPKWVPHFLNHYVAGECQLPEAAASASQLFDAHYAEFVAAQPPPPPAKPKLHPLAQAFKSSAVKFSKDADARKRALRDLRAVTTLIDRQAIRMAIKVVEKGLGERPAAATDNGSE